MQEYYLQVEFAKLIALATKSKVKQAVANKLSKEQTVYPEHVKLTVEETLDLMEQTKAMARISCQKARRKPSFRTLRRPQRNRRLLEPLPPRADRLHTKMEDIKASLKNRGVKTTIEPGFTRVTTSLRRAGNHSHRHHRPLCRQG